MHHVEGPFGAARFDHRQHVRFAWTVLAEHPLAEAVEIVAGEIRSYAAIYAPGLYHETLTQFWVRLVEHTRAHRAGSDDFDAHFARFPVLSNTRAPWEHYSTDLLASPAARATFTVPDLQPIPSS